MKLRKLFIVFLFILCLSSLFADRSAYSGADKITQSFLEKVDELIEQQQYAAAFGMLSMENEFFIAKKIEIAINYFVQSIMHQMFAFENLKEGQK